jgi:hypothetical protein
LRSSRALGLFLAVSACAHTSVGPDPARSETVCVGSACVELRFASDDAEAAEQVKRVLPGALLAAGRWGSLDTPVVLTIYASHEGLEAAANREGQPWMRAWARPSAVDLQSPRTWSRGRASDDALHQILAHELTHCVLFQTAGRARHKNDIPLWFQEGMASVTAKEVHARPPLVALAMSEPFASSDAKVFYDTADAAFRFLLARYGEDRVHLLLESLVGGRPFPVAFRDTLGVTLDEFESALRSHVTAQAGGTVGAS